MNYAADQTNDNCAESQLSKVRNSKITRLLGAYAPFWFALASLLIYYISLPPVGLRYTIFIVPMIWAALLVPYRFQRASKKEAAAESRVKRVLLFPVRFWGRGEYRQYWLAFFLFWLTTLVWVSYPHPGAILGWIALSGYLAIYLPIFVMQTRALNRALKFPIWLASALVARVRGAAKRRYGRILLRRTFTRLVRRSAPYPDRGALWRIWRRRHDRSAGGALRVG